MSIEIRDRSGRHLYLASNARDIRAAVREAIKDGANLTDAYLRDVNLTDADLTGANFTCAYLRYADLTCANLTGVNLRYADLRYANLTGADLTDADLTDADLTGANFTCAYLRGAKGLNPRRVNDLLILLDQPGKIRAYKITKANGEGIYARSNGYAPLFYKEGETYEIPNADRSDAQCGSGISLATLPWCLKEWREGYRIFLAEFESSDIASIPISDGKFRCSKVTIVSEMEIDPIALGLVSPKSE